MFAGKWPLLPHHSEVVVVFLREEQNLHSDYLVHSCGLYTPCSPGASSSPASSSSSSSEDLSSVLSGCSDPPPPFISESTSCHLSLPTQQHGAASVTDVQMWLLALRMKRRPLRMGPGDFYTTERHGTTECYSLRYPSGLAPLDCRSASFSF